MHADRAEMSIGWRLGWLCGGLERQDATIVGGVSDALRQWAEEQRALARALGWSIEAWLAELDRAGRHRAGVTAAVIGAAVARKRKMPNLSQVDGQSLAEQARALIDPEPPRTRHPVVTEAIRRATDLAEGEGARRLARTEVQRPDRAAPSSAPSASDSTADAPGESE
ncbi:MAG: hypothetical protein AAFV29_21675 [Myxococcota bacterium]